MPDRVVDAANAAREHAYAPYSGFKVGAAIETDDGRVFAGTNVENASFGVTVCAERVALGVAISSGARRFVRIVVVTDASPASAPCGTCRQALAEFGPDLVVVAVGRTGERRWTLRELLPDSFGPSDLKG